MKLYLWPNFNPDYFDGTAFAIAHDLPEAMKMIQEQYSYVLTQWGDVETHTLDEPFCYAVSGTS